MRSLPGLTVHIVSHIIFFLNCCFFQNCLPAILIVFHLLEQNWPLQFVQLEMAFKRQHG